MDESIANNEPRRKIEEPSQRFGYLVLAEAIAEERLWNKDGLEVSDRLYNTNRILEIARRLEAERLQPIVKIAMPENEELEREGRLRVNGFASHLVRDLGFPLETVTLTARFSRGSDFKVIEGDFGANRGSTIMFWDTRSPFPQREGERIKLEIPRQLIEYQAGQLLMSMQKRGVAFSPEQAWKVILGIGAVHEWAHSVEEAIEAKIKQEGKMLPGFRSEKYDVSNLGTIASLVALWKAQEVSEMPGNLDLPISDLNAIHRERFATGFEDLALQYFLKQEGVSDDVIGELARDIARQNLEIVNDYLSVATKLAEKLGIGYRDLPAVSYDIEELLAAGHVNLNMGPRYWENLGYHCGYNMEQLREITSMINVDQEWLFKKLQQSRDEDKELERV